MNRTVTAPSRAVGRGRATTRGRGRSAVVSCPLANPGETGVAAAGSIPPTILMTQLTPPTGPGPPGMTVVAAIVGAMGHAPTLDFDLSTLRRAIGGGSYVRGAEYAQQRAVLRVAWDPDGAALRGMVQGQGANVYHASAYLTLAEGQPARFDTGEASCPVAYNCKHVVALVMSALATGTIEPEPAATPSVAAPPAWDQSLDSLLGGGAPGRGGPDRRKPRRAGPRAGPGRRPRAGALGGAERAEPDRPAGPAGSQRLGRGRPELDPAGGAAARRRLPPAPGPAAARAVRALAGVQRPRQLRLPLRPGPVDRVLDDRLPAAVAAAG